MKNKILFTLLGVLSVLLVTYIVLVFYFNNHFYPNTYINGVYVGWMNAEKAQATILEADRNYRLELVTTTAERDNEQIILGSSYIDGADIDYRFEYESSAADVLASQPGGIHWFSYSKGMAEHNIAGPAAYDKDKVRDIVSGFNFMQPENMVEAVDAYIGEFDRVQVCYPIIPEIPGTVINENKLYETIDLALVSHKQTIDLLAEQCYEPPHMIATSDKLLREQAKLNESIRATITYTFGDDEVTIDASQFIDWVEVGGAAESFDREAIAAYLTDIAATYDTYDKDEEFTTVDGYVVSLSHGRFGWHMDIDAETEALIADIVSGNQITREPAYVTKGAAWGDDDIGDFYIEVNLTGQHVYVIENGEVLMDTDCVSGCMSNGNYTPGGIFGLTYKQTDATLRGADYVSYVKYWMPFNRNIGFHDASWRNKFGGEIYLRSGSHGCVNLPREAAKELYGYVYNNCPIICYYLDEDTIVSYPEATPTPSATPEPTATVAPTQVPTVEPTVEPVVVETPVVDQVLPTVDPALVAPTPVNENNSPEDLLLPDPSVVVASPAPEAQPVEQPVQQ